MESAISPLYSFAIPMGRTCTTQGFNLIIPSDQNLLSSELSGHSLRKAVPNHLLQCLQALEGRAMLSMVVFIRLFPS